MLLLERLILHYHRDYPSNQAIIIEIEPELIRIISFPGIDRSIPMRVIEAGERFSSRYYRNKRLGEFLKELELSEGKSTGIPTIQEELRKNGSPRATFTTDEDRRAVTVEIPIHPAFLEKPSIGDGNSDVSSAKPSIGATDQTRTIFEAIVSNMNCKDRVKVNIRLLYETVGDNIFGRKDIIEIVGLSPAPAGDMIKKMHAAN
ncbi:ATP-binding protein [Blautia sp.]|uniref:ATP-binding protein n=1 Tax=Blautia sp. TaxID=1955243 RepID=UPI003AB637F2